MPDEYIKFLQQTNQEFKNRNLKIKKLINMKNFDKFEKFIEIDKL
jgi:hypothetical protein